MGRKPLQVGLVDDRILQVELGPGAGGRGVHQGDRLGGPLSGIHHTLVDGRAAGQGAGVSLARSAAGKVHPVALARRQHRRRDQIVRELPSIGIVEELVRIEAIPAGVAIAAKAGGRVPAPPGVVQRPVRAPGAKGVEGGSRHLRHRRPPDVIRALGHRVVERRVRLGVRAVDLEHHGRGVGGIDPHLQRAAVAPREGRA